LVEDSLGLWHVTLQNARGMTQDLLGLFPLLRPYFDSEFLKPAMDILNSYVLMGGLSFMNVRKEGKEEGRSAARYGFFCCHCRSEKLLSLFQ